MDVLVVLDLLLFKALEEYGASVYMAEARKDI